MAIVQAIQAHGHGFQVESDEPLAEYQKNLLVSAMEQFSPQQMEILSTGKVGESPLKIYVVPKSQWSVFHPHDPGQTGKYPELTKGFYCPSNNIMMLDKGKIPAHPIFDADGGEKRKLKRHIKHEFGHALDDFAVVRFENVTMLEIGSASTTYSDIFYAGDIGSDRQIPSIIRAFLTLIYGDHSNNDKERFTAVINYLTDSERQDSFRRFAEYLEEKPNLLWFLTQGQEECTEEECVEMGKQLSEHSLLLTEFESRDPFFQAVKTFLDNYPQIPGVPLEEQYDTGFWLPILRIRLL